jgi:hypothetical protein
VTIPSDENFEPVRGLHEPIINQETFDRVQAILDGRTPSASPKRKFNPALPSLSYIVDYTNRSAMQDQLFSKIVEEVKNGKGQLAWASSSSGGPARKTNYSA